MIMKSYIICMINELLISFKIKITDNCFNFIEDKSLKAHWQISKNGVSKSIVHLIIKHANFYLRVERVDSDGVI